MPETHEGERVVRNKNPVISNTMALKFGRQIVVVDKCSVNYGLTCMG